MGKRASARIWTGLLVLVQDRAVQTDASIDVQRHPEMNMVARLFDETATLYGETKLGDIQAVFVATENADTTRATLRTREPGELPVVVGNAPRLVSLPRG
jgi:hypothetical protein